MHRRKRRLLVVPVLIKSKNNGKMKGKWLDSVQGSRSFILLSDVSEIDERTVL